MAALKQNHANPKVKLSTSQITLACRCGGKPSKPKEVAGCKNRWIISCQVKNCYAYNIGQGLYNTIQGWNNLSTHLYR
jgi:hypothetical protein